MTDADELLALLTPKEQTKLLQALLQDKETRPAVEAAMQPLLADMPATRRCGRGWRPKSSACDQTRTR